MDHTTTASKAWLLCLMLAALTILTFWPVIHNDFINFDDPHYVTENVHVKAGLTWDGLKWAFTTGHASNWHPVTWLSHMTDVSLFGTKPFGHHAINLLFHTANAVLLLLLFWQTTGALWRSTIVAALFVLHPLHVESVAWVAERKDVLSTFFGLLSLLAYTRYAKHSIFHPPSSILAGFKTPAYWLAIVFLALGLMSKAMLVTWPFVMLLLDMWPLRRVVPSPSNFRLSTLKPLLLEKLPFLALVVISCFVTVLVQQHGGAVSTENNLPLEDRLGNAIVSYPKYLAKTLWPSDLTIFYPHPLIRYPASEQWPGWLIVVTGLILLVISKWVSSRPKEQGYLATGWFWYLGTLVPVIGLIQVGTQAMADRYTYVPLIGFFLCVTWAVADLLTNRRRICGLLAVVLISSCVVMTRGQVKTWKNDFTVFGHALKVNPRNHVAHSILGKAAAQQGKHQEALTHFLAALDANPHHADAHHDMGLTYYAMGNYAAAAEQFEAQLRVRPNYIWSYNGLAAVHWANREDDQALNNWQQALRLDPMSVEANYGAGLLMLAKGRLEEAAAHFSKVRAINPNHLKAQESLGKTLVLMGRFSEAVTNLSPVVGRDTNSDLRVMLAYALSETGQTNSATPEFKAIALSQPDLALQFLQEGKEYQKNSQAQPALVCFAIAARINPESPEIQMNLGALVGAQGRFAEAVTYFEKAVLLRPSFDGFYNLALANALRGEAALAVKNLEQALTLQSDSPVALNELAWILATHPDPAIRNGSRAVELALRACALTENEPRYWGTLDAAYAENGRFADAIRTAEKARAMALNKNQEDVVKAADERLALYRQQKPYRQTNEPK